MKVYVRGHKVGDGFVGRLIGWFTWGQYKHISMAFVQDDGSVRGFQSNAKHGVHFFEWADDPKTDLYEVPCSNEQAYEILSAAKSIVGSKYDYGGLWGFVRRAKRHSVLKWFCSEASCFVIECAGIKLQRLPPFKISPVLECASTVLIPRPELKLKG